MKKIVLLLLVGLSLTGCTAVRINTKDIDNTINVILSKNNTLYNRVGKGYKYYVPRGVSYIDTVEFNDKLYSNGDYYYLYIDAVGYYYKAKIDIKEDKNSYYFKKIKINNKEGYLKIIEKKDGYHIEFVYNYAKIEAVVNEDRIEDVVLNATYILSTVKFNPEVIKLMLDDEFFTNKEEKYDIFESESEDNNFLNYTDDNEEENQ